MGELGVSRTAGESLGEDQNETEDTRARRLLCRPRKFSPTQGRRLLRDLFFRWRPLDVPVSASDPRPDWYPFFPSTLSSGPVEVTMSVSLLSSVTVRDGRCVTSQTPRGDNSFSSAATASHSSTPMSVLKDLIPSPTLRKGSVTL